MSVQWWCEPYNFEERSKGEQAIQLMEAYQAQRNNEPVLDSLRDRVNSLKKELEHAEQELLEALNCVQAVAYDIMLAEELYKQAK